MSRRLTRVPAADPGVVRRFLTTEELAARKAKALARQGLQPGGFRATLEERRAANRAAQPPEGDPTMGYKITAVRRENPGSPLVAVPEEVAKELEESYAYLTENPKMALLATFDTADEVKEFTRQAKSWAQTRPGGAVDFRKLPSNGLGDKSFRFRITAPKPAEAAPAEGEAPAETPAEAPKETAKAK